MGKRRRKRAGFWLKGICLILLVPVFITTLMQRMRLENLIYGKEGAQEVLNTIDSVEGMEREVREHQENKKDILSGQAETQSGDSKDEDEETEMKVLQIVAQEIGIDKSAETIKAQSPERICMMPCRRGRRNRRACRRISSRSFGEKILIKIIRN